MYIKEKLIECDEFTETEIDKFEDDLDRYTSHKNFQAEEKKRLEVDENALEFRSEKHVMDEMRFFYLMLKIQNKKKKHMNEAELKVWSLRREFTDTEENDDEDLYSTDEEGGEDDS
jgi:hypothetical protein